MARPKIEINYEEAEKLGALMCTLDEVASFFGCSKKTLERNEEFCRYYKKGKERGKISLRRMQFDLAKRNTSMAIFLGKQWLGQKDEGVENEDEFVDNIKITFEDASEDSTS